MSDAQKTILTAIGASPISYFTDGAQAQAEQTRRVPETRSEEEKPRPTEAEGADKKAEARTSGLPNQPPSGGSAKLCAVAG